MPLPAIEVRTGQGSEQQRPNGPVDLRRVHVQAAVLGLLSQAGQLRWRGLKALHVILDQLPAGLGLVTAEGRGLDLLRVAALLHVLHHLVGHLHLGGQAIRVIEDLPWYRARLARWLDENHLRRQAGLAVLPLADVRRAAVGELHRPGQVRRTGAAPAAPKEEAADPPQAHAQQQRRRHQVGVEPHRQFAELQVPPAGHEGPQEAAVELEAAGAKVENAARVGGELLVPVVDDVERPSPRGAEEEGDEAQVQDDVRVELDLPRAAGHPPGGGQKADQDHEAVAGHREATDGEEFRMHAR